MNENWARWIVASINDFFSSKKDTLTLYIESDDRDTTGLPNWVEVRINGPTIEQLTINSWKVSVDINCLVMNIVDNTDLYKLQRLIGKVMKIYESVITVFKYGDGDDFLGCLELKSEVSVDNYGIVNPQTKLEHSIVQAKYEMFL